MPTPPLLLTPKSASVMKKVIAREDRFYVTVPFVTQAEFYYQTNFLRCYDQTVRCPTIDVVVQGLRDLHSDTQNFNRIIRSLQQEPDAYDVIRLYTSNTYWSGKHFTTTSTNNYVKIKWQLFPS